MVRTGMGGRFIQYFAIFYEILFFLIFDLFKYNFRTYHTLQN